MRANRRHLCGFTVIEMLTVLAIISILMGLLVPVIWQARKSGQIRATQLLIKTVGAALERYYQDFDAYPPSNDGHLGAFQADSLYAFLNGPNGTGFVINGKQYGPYLESLPSENLAVSNGLKLVVDVWHHPLIYWNCKAYLQTNQGGALYCHNRTFDIYSIGADGKTDPQNDGIDNNSDGRVDKPAELVDDITNW